ncbi:MAG: hypothetical protein U5O15_03510 [Candidatus Krumholzibacteriota bacterium]|nr:hypothetical protein [Candidatus Krumholzibacteriota bacterium]
MKIKEFSITHYGPLADRGRTVLGDFNLLWGGNEYGKTLTIDALVKMLLGGKKAGCFEMINRVEEIPEGYLILDNNNVEVKLPEAGTLTDNADLSVSECRNIFVVRNSDLSIAADPKDESDFYTSVTDRLTGLRTGEISRIMKNLEDIGKITPTGIFKDVEGEKLKTRINSAEKLIEEINVLSDQIDEEGFDEFEQESARLNREIARIDEEIQSLEYAREREKYRKAKEALEELKKALLKKRDFGIFNEDDRQLWRDCEREIQDCAGKKEKLSVELTEIREELKEIAEKLEEKEREFKILDDRKKTLDYDIRPQLEDYKSSHKKLEKKKKKNSFISGIMIISAILLALSMAGIIFSSKSLFYISAALFFIPLLTAVIVKGQIARGEGRLTEKFESSRIALSQFGLDAGDLFGVIEKIRQFDEEYRGKNDKLHQIRRKKENLESRFDNLDKKRIPEVENEIKAAEREITRLKTESKEESFESYKRKLELKYELGRLIEKEKNILSTQFDRKGDELEENILYWEKETAGLKRYRDKAAGKEYNESYRVELKEKKKILGDKHEEINNKMKNILGKLGDVQRRANNILINRHDHLLCSTSVDLRAVKDKLREFMATRKDTKENVMEIIKIFEEIEREEKEKVSELFGKESLISEFFAEITGGFYKEVIYNRETDNIEVRREDGRILEAVKLSGGAYDQLYFSVRLALGEKLLKDKRGFFIMDDPFIKADPERLQRQMETLKNIARRGWQIIYFSSKGEVKSVLEKDIRKGAVKYIEIKSIFS